MKRIAPFVAAVFAVLVIISCMAADLERVPVTTSVYTRQLLTNQTRAQLISFIGIADSNITFNTDQFTLVGSNVNFRSSGPIMTNLLLKSGMTNDWATASTVPYHDANKALVSSDVTPTELDYLDGVTSAIQTQIDGKQASDADLTALAALSTTGIGVRTGSGTWTTRSLTGNANQFTIADGDGVSAAPYFDIKSGVLLSNVVAYGGFTNDALTASTALYSDANKKVTSLASVSDTELGYLDGVTSAIQTQLNGKANTTAANFTNLTVYGQESRGVITNFWGESGAPSITFSNDTDTGIYHPAGVDGYLTLVSDGTDKLQVWDYITSFAPIRVSNGGAASPEFSFGVETNLGIYRPASGQLGITVGGTARVKVAATGMLNTVALTNQGAATLESTLTLAPSSLQTLAAANAVLANATKVRVVGSGGAVTLTSTPSIADGADGQLLYIMGTSDSNTLAIQDEAALVGSNVQLGVSTNRTLGLGDILVLLYDATAGFWYEVSWANN